MMLERKKVSQPYKNVRLPLNNSQPVIHQMSLTNIHKWLKERHVNAFNFLVTLLFRYTVEFTYVGQHATVDRIRKLVYTCVILQNMILHDSGKAISPVHIRDPPIQPVFDEAALVEIRNENTHFRLRFDLMEHIHAQQLPYLEVNDEDDED